MKLLPWIALFALVGCSHKRSEARSEPSAAAEPGAVVAEARPSAPAQAPAQAAPAAAIETGIPSDFPPACVTYAALIDKLAACDKIGEGREGMARGYRELRAAWATLPAAQRGTIDGQCRTQADSLRNAAAATCGW